jgi:SulP family sulfate permease
MVMACKPIAAPRADQQAAQLILNALVGGQLFFASADDFMAAFDFGEPLKRVCIDASRAHISDRTGTNAVDLAVLKFRREGIEVEVAGLNEASTTIMGGLAVHNDLRAMEKVFGRSTPAARV